MWLLGLLACTDPVPTPATAAPVGVDKLVIVVLDGVRVEESFGDGTALDGTATADMMPTVRSQLLPLAARVAPAVQTGATSTTPGHCDLLAGRNVPHGHFNIKEDGGVGDYIPEWPTMVQAFLEAAPDRTALITGDTPHTEGLVSTLYPGAEGVAAWENFAAGGLETEDDAVVVDRLIETLHSDTPPDFVLANLHAMDTQAHLEDEDGYLAGVRASDTFVIRIWKALQQDADYADRTLLVITSDHGRHSTGDAVWSDHGDLCTGCREIPIVLIGPGAKAGAAVDTPWALVDLAPTLAHILGFSMPFAEGLVMEDLLAEPGVVTPRSGLVDLEGLSVGVELLADPLHRSRVVVDGVEVSSTDALEARGPTGVAGSSLLCWREIASAGEEYWPWQAQCAEESDGVWTPVAFPATRVDPWWRPALARVGDAVWASWGENPGGGVSKDDEPPDPVPLARRAGGEWRVATTNVYGYFTSAPSMAAVGETAAVLAFAASDDPGRGRYTRKIRLYRADWPIDSVDATWSSESTLSVDAEVTRQERPSVKVAGDRVDVAFLAYGAGRTWVYAGRSADAGATWSDSRRVSGADQVLPHLGPVWDTTGRLWWGALDETGQAQVCSVTLDVEEGDTSADSGAVAPPDGTGDSDTGAVATCQQVGSERIASLTASGAGVRAAVDLGVGQWEDLVFN